MDLLIISDTHGAVDALLQVTRRTRPDAILFAGDGLYDLFRAQPSCPVYAVRGNCDFYLPPVLFANGEAESESLFYIEDKKVLLTHGHTLNAKSGLEAMVEHAIRKEADILIFGHTHRPFEKRLQAGECYGSSSLPTAKPLWIFNPGSLGQDSHTFGTMTLRKGQLLFNHAEV